MLNTVFFDGFEKRAWGIPLKVGLTPEVSEELNSIKNELRELRSSSITGLENVAERTTDNVFKKMEKWRSPRKMIGMGLTLGAGLAGGALIGRAITKGVGKNMPIINKADAFQDETTNPQYGVNR